MHELVRRLLLGTGERIAGIVYGTIIVMAVIAAASEGAHSDTARIAALALATNVVLWLAHVYSHALEVSVDNGRRLTWEELPELARREASVLRAAVPPTVALLLGAFGLISDRAAIWLALGLGTAALASQALVYARIERLGLLATSVSVALNLSLGLTVVALEAFLAH